MAPPLRTIVVEPCTVLPQTPSSEEPPHTVLIAASGGVVSAEACLPPGQAERLLSFTDADIQAAVGAIIDTRPSVIALERSFAVSPRGGALVNRIRLDPELRNTVIQVVDADGDPPGVVPLSPHAIIPSAGVSGSPLSPPDYRGTRQMPRARFDLGVLVKVDGDPATVVDMSHQGAQVLIAQPLRPEQRIRMWSDRPHPGFRCEACVVWVQFELHAGSGGYYRAGVQFINAKPENIDAFCSARPGTTAVA